jgi:hypothetical protein
MKENEMGGVHESKEKRIKRVCRNTWKKNATQKFGRRREGNVEMDAEWMDCELDSALGRVMGYFENDTEICESIN